MDEKAMIDLSNIFSAVIGGGFVTVLIAYFVNRKERNLLIEKWMNSLRNEVALFLGKCEQLRLLGQNEQKFDFSNPIYSEIIHSMYKIEMLLNKDDSNQKDLKHFVEELRELADGSNFPQFDEAEKKVVETTMLILNDHWKKINSELRYPISS